MTIEDEFKAVVDACLKAHEAVALSGTAEMRLLTRLLLFQLGREIAHAEAKQQGPLNDN